MKLFLTKLICFFILTVPSVLNAQTASSKIGDFDSFLDVGKPQITGAAKYDQQNQTYSLTGSGSNIWFKADHFAFLSKKMNGDFIIQTQVAFVNKGHELHRKAGLMIRSSLDSSSAVVACTVHGDGLTSLQFRKGNAETMKEIKLKISGPDVLQLEKKGNKFIMSVAHFGELYQVQEIDSINLGNDLLAGLFVCSHTNKFSEQANFVNTRIFYTAPDSLVQYKTYLGSLLETVDVTTGKRQELSRSTISLQAPNWTPDGKTLIYNSQGKLYNFNIATKEATVLNTDFAIKNNNDHVLSFDGKQIGISNQGVETKGKSAVYTVSSKGGIPKLITQNNPSYFHGWSPNSKLLLYTGERNGNFDIYQISKDGGNEIQLTNAEGLDDGSEYSSDGKHIYFCSTRTGRMQLWRMNPDGSEQTQLTFDDWNNWFPHVSPDNKTLAFISFSKDIPADKHPFYQRVYIRTMPIEGGPIKVVAYLYGGQGSMNVPSWSPDSKKIAFVSNGIF
jgi:TolB protein